VEKVTFISKQAQRFSEFVICSVYVCDLPEKYEQLKKEFEGYHIQ
jgi:hypothetical protein